MTTVAPPAPPTPPAPVPAASRSIGRTLLTAPLQPEAWRAFGYLVVRVPLAAVAFALVPLLAVSTGLSITLVGIPMVALVVLAARGFGAVQRRVTRAVLHRRLADPARFRRRPGPTGWLGAALGDLVGWRAIAYVLVSFPVVVAGAYAVAVWIGLGVGGLTYPVWWSAGGGPGERRDGVLQLAGWHADTWVEALAVALVGLALLWLAPWLVRGVVALDLLLQRWLLVGPAAEQRMVALEAARAEVVEDAAATLRRVERDLHDGTHAQLVAVAMTLDRARGRLAAGDAQGAGVLLDGAHGAAKEALTDLRDVVRRIHPPVLDQGLAPALQTLAARCVLPVRLDVDVPVRPEAGVETIAYFCVAELLTNVVRHSGARSAGVTVHGDGRGDLTMTVRDDGHGGAAVVAWRNGSDGTGLAGLAQRVGAVDGRLAVDSPAGGPTVVTVHVPSGAPR